jgi:hypothetical protein
LGGGKRKFDFALTPINLRAAIDFDLRWKESSASAYPIKVKVVPGKRMENKPGTFFPCQLDLRHGLLTVAGGVFHLSTIKLRPLLTCLLQARGLLQIVDSGSVVLLG